MNPGFPRGRHLGLRWEVVSNHFDGDTFRASLTITNHGDVRLPARGWSLYFNCCRKPLPESVTGGVVIEHVNGDFFRLSPGPRFGSLAPGVSREIGYVASLWAVVETDAPLGFFIVYDEGTLDARAELVGDPLVAPFTRPEQLARTLADRVPPDDAASRFEANARSSLLAENAVGKITPLPVQASYAPGAFVIEPGTCVVHGPELAMQARALANTLSNLMTAHVQLAASAEGGAIRLRLDPALAPPASGIAEQAYRLQVGPNGVEIVARNADGAHFGIQSLLQLLPVAAWTNRAARLPVPHCEIKDAPRFAYRGLLLDVARNFSNVRTVLDVLDWMAFYKLNALHFHLTDDEGWRVAIATLPELTEVGSRRGFGRDESEWLVPSFGSGPDAEGEQGSGHYSREDFIRILRHAKERRIEVVPEIDLPGHARAAIKSMQTRCERLRVAGRLDEAETYRLVDVNDASKYESVQMWKDNVVCIGLESCYTFIDTVVRDIKALYDEAGVELRTLHVGGDEVPHGAWEQSPVCQAFMREQGMTKVRELEDYFWARVRDILHRYEIEMASWEEVAVVTEKKGDNAISKPSPKLLDSRLRPHVWNNVWGWGREDIAYQLANAGYEVVLCNVTNLYLDLAYEKDPAEPGYYWGGFLETRRVFEFCPFDIYTMAKVDLFGRPLEPAKLAEMARLTAEGERRVLGIQGQLFGENLRDRTRVEYLLLPRLIAVAERAWSADPGWTRIANHAKRDERLDRDWNDFANRLGQRELPRLDGMFGGVGYRIPVPGAKVEKGSLSANVSIPGLTLRYTLDGSEPTALSHAYEGPLVLPEGSQPRVAAFTTTGRRGRAAAPKI